MSEIVSKPSTPEYEESWSRVFGSKKETKKQEDSWDKCYEQ